MAFRSTRIIRLLLAAAAFVVTHQSMAATEQEFQDMGIAGFPVKPSDTDSAIQHHSRTSTPNP